MAFTLVLLFAPEIGSVPSLEVCYLATGVSAANFTYDFLCLDLAKNGSLTLNSSGLVTWAPSSTMGPYSFDPHLSASPSSLCYTVFPIGSDFASVPGRCYLRASVAPTPTSPWASSLCTDYYYNAQDQIQMIDNTACFQCSGSYIDGQGFPSSYGGCYNVQNASYILAPSTFSSASAVGINMASALGKDLNGKIYWLKATGVIDANNFTSVYLYLLSAETVGVNSELRTSLLE